MTNWIDRFFPKAPAARASNLPATSQPVQPPAPFNNPQGRVIPLTGQALKNGRLPNATIVYAMAASGLTVMAIYLFFTGNWFTAFLVLLLAICFLGFAMHFLRHAQ